MIRIATYLCAVGLIASTSAGVLLQHHFCQNELKSASVWFKPKTCHEVDQRKSCPMHTSAMPQDENKCCDTRSTFLQDETDQVHLVSPLLKDLQHDLAIPDCGYDLHDRTRVVLPEYLNYKPPLIRRDPISELQTFLC